MAHLLPPAFGADLPLIFLGQPLPKEFSLMLVQLPPGRNRLEQGKSHPDVCAATRGLSNSRSGYNPCTVCLDPIRSNHEGCFCDMSDQFFYVHLKFTPKIGTDRAPMTKQHEAVVEVPKDLVQRSQSRNFKRESKGKGNGSGSREKSCSGRIPDYSRTRCGIV